MVKNKFDGATYDDDKDYDRLMNCFNCVKKVMEGHKWFTLDEIQKEIQAKWNKYYSVTSISARIRDLRKPKFGEYKVQSRRRGESARGVFEYKLED